MNERFGLADSSESASTVRCGSVKQPHAKPHGANLFPGCGYTCGTDTQTGWVMMVLREIVRSQAGVLCWTWSCGPVWCILGSALAVVCLHVFFPARDGMRCVGDLREACAGRSLLRDRLAAAVLLGLAGFWIGSLTARKGIAKEPVGLRRLSRNRQCHADGMAWILSTPFLAAIRTKSQWLPHLMNSEPGTGNSTLPFSGGA